MRIVSWNVNGLRAVLKNTGKSLKQFLDDFEAEIICLQETKATSRELGTVLGSKSSMWLSSSSPHRGTAG